MNKKEVGEIRKHFTDASGFMVMHRMLTAYIDPEKNVRCRQVQSCITMPEDSRAVWKDTLRRVLSPSVGKALTEYAFPNEQYAQGGTQRMLYQLLQTKLEAEEPIDAFLTHLSEKIQYASAFAFTCAYCTYTIRTKDKNDEYNETADEEYSFLLAGFCPANTGDDGFIYSEFDNALVKKENTELIVSKAPSDGFLFPVFSDRSPDINHVMYYSQKPNKPNLSIVEDVLGCQFLMCPKEEKAEFQTILRTVAGDDLNYMMITSVNERLAEVAADHKTETEVPTLDSSKLKDLLYDVGVSREKLDVVETVYQKTVGDAPLTVSNLIETKTVVSTPEITVHIKPGATDKVRTSVIGGRHCLLIDLDDPCVEINGLTAKLYQPAASKE